MVANVVIIGSGPAGYTAAIYAARAQLEPIVFEGFQSGGIPGGQLMTTTDVENFPGFPAGIQGPALMDRMRQQAQRWGAQLITEDVITVDLQERPFRVSTARQTLSCHSVIIATGATAKRLNLPSETIYWNRGISACAICDGASPLFRDRAVAVVGGGDTAAEESIFLTKYASHVHLLVRRDRLRASKTMQARLLSHPKITVHWHTETIDALGDQKTLQALSLRDTISGETRELKVQGLFYAIGHTPNTEIFAGQLDLDAAGYIQANPQTMATAIAGIYAAGDVQDHEYRQAITAAGTGCAAALQAERYLSHHDLIQPPSRSPADLEKAWLSDHVESIGETAPETETSEDPDIFEFDLV